VLFVESLGLRRPTLTGRDIRRMARRVRRAMAGVHRARVSDGYVSVLSPLVIPAHNHETIRRLNRLLLKAQVSYAARRLRMYRPLLWSYVPQAEPLIRSLRPRLVIYHAVDDIAAHERIDTDSFAIAEQTFASQADLVFASSRPLAERLARIACDVRYMPNVADVGRFVTALEDGPVDPDVACLRRPRLLFFGAIAGVKVDFALLIEIADARPHWEIALVGPVGLGDPNTNIEQLLSRPNVHYLGVRRHEDLPAVLRGVNVSLIPYKANDLTRSIFPLKIYESLAAGVPVVSTPLPSLAGVAGVLIADGAGEMLTAIDSCLEHDAPHDRAARSQLARGHSWERRLTELTSAILEKDSMQI
jgi:glycosyltransferase involved in cell wall biosynthesis